MVSDVLRDSRTAVMWDREPITQWREVEVVQVNKRHPTVTHPTLSLIPEHGEHLLAVVIIGNAILKWVGGWVEGETYSFVMKKSKQQCGKHLRKCGSEQER